MAEISDTHKAAIISERVEEMLELSTQTVYEVVVSIGIMGKRKPEDAQQPFENLGKKCNASLVEITPLMQEIAGTAKTEVLQTDQSSKNGFDSA